MKTPKFKIGDKVKVMRASTDAEYDLWMDSWVGEMNISIGKVLTIGYVYNNSWQNNCEYCKYLMKESSYGYPEFVLQGADIPIGQQLSFDFMSEK